MHFLYQSNRLEHLAELLAQVLRAQPPAPLAAETVLVHSPGMGTWLQLQLAANRGVAANLRFVLPSSFFWQLHRRTRPSLPPQSVWDKPALVWQLLTILPQLLEHPSAAPLRKYLHPDSPQRRYRLCRQLADLYDQYLVYRPDWIQQWEQGDDGPEPEHLRWQAVLWQQLSQHIHSRWPEDVHRAALMSVEHLRSVAPDSGLQRLFVFGPSSQPAAQLAALGVLGEHLDVHLFMLNPSQQYWGDIRSDRQLARRRVEALQQGVPLESLPDEVGNPLLASLGHQGREQLELLLGGLWGDDIQDIDVFDAPQPDTLLGQVQRDIHDLRDGREQPQPPAPANIALHCCHSPMREVEVLHDQLLAWFEADPTLEPRDIVVMMPDVAGYAPLIEAVFSRAEPVRIPWAIADRTLTDESPLVRAFLLMLQPDLHRFTANELMELLDVPAVRDRYGLAVEDLPLLRGWVQDTHIRWGLDGAHRGRLGLPEFADNTWIKGLERLLLGVALGEDSQLWRARPNLPDVSAAQAELAGRLAWLVRQLQQHQQRLARAGDAASWRQRLLILLDDLFAADSAEPVALELLRRQIGALSQHLQDSVGERAPVSLSLVQSWLQDQLGSSVGGQRFLAGRVNFCTLMPMRSVPFRRVCLLGMNDDAYPRPEQPMAHDLLRLLPRPGDRSRRSEDRYLFLEALLSARDGLLISWCGRDGRDNSERPPSVVLAELMDYLDAAFEASPPLSQQLRLDHPLQPFSRRYFGDDPALFSYSPLWASVAVPMPTPEPPPVASAALPDGLRRVTLNDLGRCLRQPLAWYLEQRLGVPQDRSDDVLEDDEPFAADGLTRWQIRQEVLEALEGGADPHARAPYWEHSGALPPGIPGQVFLEQTLGEASEQLARTLALRRDQGTVLPPLAQTLYAGPLSLDLTVRELDCAGWDSVQVGKILNREPYAKLQRLSASKAPLRLGRVLPFWLQHLAINSFDAVPEGSRTSRLLGEDMMLVLLPLPAAEARQVLEQLLQFYGESLQRPQPFLPEAAWKACQLSGELDETERHEQLLATLWGSDRHPGEGQQPASLRLFPQWSAQDLAALYRLGRQLLQSLWQYGELHPYA